MAYEITKYVGNIIFILNKNFEYIIWKTIWINTIFLVNFKLKVIISSENW